MMKPFSFIAAALGFVFNASAEPAPAPALPPGAVSPAFAVSMYHELAKTADGNVFFSPISIQSALAMTGQGARGETAKQIADVIRIGDADAFARLLAGLQVQGDEKAPRMTLTIANAIWAQEAYPFDQAYVDLVRRQFAAEARGLDFGQSEASRQIINDWVEKKTNQKIKDLLPQGSINNLTRLVLTNAVYFKADWRSKFEKSMTQDAPFHLSAGEAEGQGKTVKLMRQIEKFGYYDAKTHHVVVLPYAGTGQGMLLMVPKEIGGLKDVEASLTPEALQQAIAGLAIREIDLSLPRFKIDQAASLADILKKLGMSVAFDAEKADFSGMTTAEKLEISDVLHKAFCEVDENGTEAAAATAVIMGVMSAPPMEKPDPIVVRVDRPFVFAIIDGTTQAVLFMGRVADPG